MVKIIGALAILGGVGNIIFGAANRSVHDIISGSLVVGLGVFLFYRSRQSQGKAIVLDTPALVVATAGGLAIIVVFIMLAVNNGGTTDRIFFLAAAVVVAAFVAYLYWQRRRPTGSGSSLGS